MSAKKIFILGFIIILLIAIPLTIYVLQQQQETRSRATAATVVSFEPSAKAVKVGDTFTLDINVDPSSNVVTLVQLFITYDPTKLATASADNVGTGLVPNERALPVIMNDAVKYTENSIFVSLSPGADVSKFIQTKTKVATLVMKALAPTDTSSAKIELDKGVGVNKTDIRSKESQIGENVLSTTIPAVITINPASGSGSSSNNVVPTCTALNVDRTTSGPAPFSITFTAAGNDSNGTIQKVTFSFGDGGVADVDKNNGTNGIGTNSVNAQMSHAYQNPGTFTASAVLTDNQGGVSSASASCTQTIIVTQPIINPTATPSSSLTPTTIFVTATPTPGSSQGNVNPTVAPPGPGETILKIGGVGMVLSILGGLLFLAL